MDPADNTAAVAGCCRLLCASSLFSLCLLPY
jgi:hypothetical protein